MLLAIINPVEAQQFSGYGTYVVGATNRSPANKERFNYGDQITVSVIYPANSGRIYVSAHMEYLTGGGEWRPVPITKAAFGSKYRSGAYPGVRDYVMIEGYPNDRVLHAGLFVPVEVADFLPGQHLERRYVLRLWDRSNQEIRSITLPREKVEVAVEDGVTRLLSNADLDKHAAIRLFDTETGSWVSTVDLRTESSAQETREIEAPK